MIEMRWDSAGLRIREFARLRAPVATRPKQWDLGELHSSGIFLGSWRQRHTGSGCGLILLGQPDPGGQWAAFWLGADEGEIGGYAECVPALLKQYWSLNEHAWHASCGLAGMSIVLDWDAARAAIGGAHIEHYSVNKECIVAGIHYGSGVVVKADRFVLGRQESKDLRRWPLSHGGMWGDAAGRAVLSDGSAVTVLYGHGGAALLMSHPGSDQWERLDGAMGNSDRKKLEREGVWPLRGVYEVNGTRELINVWCGRQPWWASRREEQLVLLVYDRAGRSWTSIPTELTGDTWP